MAEEVLAGCLHQRHDILQVLGIEARTCPNDLTVDLGIVRRVLLENGLDLVTGLLRVLGRGQSKAKFEGRDRSKDIASPCTRREAFCSSH